MMNYSVKKYIFCGIAIIVLLIIGINIGYDRYRKTESERIHKIALQVADSADKAMKEYKNNIRDRERILILEKIHTSRELNSLEKKEAIELIESQIAYCKKQSNQGARDYEQALIRIRSEWGLE